MNVSYVSNRAEIVTIAPPHQFHHETKRELLFKGRLYIFSVLFPCKMFKQQCRLE